MLSRACGEASLWSPTLAHSKHDSHDLPRRLLNQDEASKEPAVRSSSQNATSSGQSGSAAACPCKSHLLGRAASPYSRGEGTAACSWSAVTEITPNVVKVHNAHSSMPNEVGGGVDDVEWQVAGGTASSPPVRLPRRREREVELQAIFSTSPYPFSLFLSDRRDASEWRCHRRASLAGHVDQFNTQYRLRRRRRSLQWCPRRPLVKWKMMTTMS